MIYDVNTYYVNSNTDARVIRYDVFKIDSDTYRVKVMDDQQRDISPPHILVKIDDFLITRADYNQKYPTGIQQTVRLEMAPGFENSIKSRLQEHRDNIS